MKNVMVFQDYDTSDTYGHQWKQEELFKYFKCQIDNSINHGWEPKDICIGESKCLKSLYKEINKYQFEDKPDYEKLRAMLCELRDIEKKKAQLI